MRHMIEPPVIIDESGDTDVFETVESAELYLEAIDVEDNRFIGFDSRGRLLRLLPTTPRITIELAELVPNHSEQLRVVLIEFLSACGCAEPDLSDLTLQQLVQKSLAFTTK